MTLKEKVNEAKVFVETQLNPNAEIGIILGTGLGGLTKEIDIEKELDYSSIPNFPVSTVESHSGKLIYGELGGKKVIAFQGRFHLYEGYSAQEVTIPVRLAGELGIKTLIISNAAGGMNTNFRRGDLMAITDHINLQGFNPLVGANEDSWGPRFPDMSEPYSSELLELAKRLALEKGIDLQRGVYVSVLGPNLETRAEYRFLKKIGADAVGMSTVPEVIAAVHMGIEIVAFSVITDECFPDALKPISIPEILAAAAEAEPKLTALTKGLVSSIS